MKPIKQIISEYIKATNSANIEELIRATGKRELSYDDAGSILVWASSFENFPAFLKLKSRIKSPSDYWRLLADTYQMSDNLYHLRNEVRECFLADVPNRDELMDDSEKALLQSLPEELAIYRGMTVLEAETKEYGVSWTLSKERAEFFAFEYWRNLDTNGMEKTVISKQVDKEQIIALFEGRNEQEVIFIE